MGGYARYCRRTGAWLVALGWLSILLGCGGGAATGQQPTETPLAEQAVQAPVGADVAPADSFPTLPVDAAVDPVEIIARRADYALTQEWSGAQCYSRAANTILDLDLSTAQLVAGSYDVSWVVYEIPDLVPADLPVLVSISMLPELTAHPYFGLANYAKKTWSWQELPAGVATYNFGVSTSMYPISPGGSVYLAILCYDDDSAVVKKVTCTREVIAPPPVGLQASDGDYGGVIHLTWEDPAITYPGLEYDCIVIERKTWVHGDWSTHGQVSAGQTSYEDIYDQETNSIWPGAVINYRLRTVENGVEGEPSLEDTGYWTLEPVRNLDASDGLFYDRVELSWDASPGVDGYQIWYRYVGWSGIPEMWELAWVEGDDNCSFSHTATYPPEDPLYYDVETNYFVEAYFQGIIAESIESDTGWRQLNPPTNIQASEDAYPDYIQLTWDKREGATGYLVYRDTVASTRLVATLGDVDSWQDDPGDSELHNYWLRATTDDAVSEPSEMASGSRCAWHVHQPSAEELWWSDHALAVQDGVPIVVYYEAADENRQVIFARAGSAKPAASGDWTQHVALAVPVAYDLALAIIDGKPAFCFNDDEAFYFARALVAYPTSSADWQVHEVESPFFAMRDAVLVELDHRPTVLGKFNNALRFFVAGDATPTASTDWSSHFVSSTNSQYGVSLLVFNGKPVGVHVDDYEPYVCISSEVIPTAAEDWSCHSITSAPYRYVSSGIAASVVDGRLAVAFGRAWGDRLAYARALVDLPTSNADWHIHDIALNLDSPIPALTEYNGVPVIIYCTGWGDTADIKMVAAGTALPTFAADWSTRNVFDKENTLGLTWFVTTTDTGTSLVTLFDVDIDGYVGCME